MARRAQAREEPVADQTHLTALAHFLTPSRDAVGNETGAAVAAALAALGEGHREVITLARVVRLPHRVIAEVMEHSEAATRQLLARALLRLAAELRARGIDVEQAR